MYVQALLAYSNTLVVCEKHLFFLFFQHYINVTLGIPSLHFLVANLKAKRRIWTKLLYRFDLSKSPAPHSVDGQSSSAWYDFKAVSATCMTAIVFVPE